VDPGEAEADLIPAFVNREAGTAPAAIRSISGDRRFSLREVAPAELAKAIGEEVRRGTRRILVGGGDGTIASAAAEILGHEVELAILPAGSLNHFAADQGLPLDDPGKALDIAAASPVRRVDVGLLNDLPFLSTSSLGAYVDFVRRRDRWRARLGYHLGSAFSAAGTLLRLRTATVGLGTDEGAGSYRTPLVFVGVGERSLRRESFGRRLEQGRGGLHLIVVHDAPPHRLIGRGLVALVRGGGVSVRAGHVDSWILDRCAVEPEGRRAKIAMDGETREMETPLRYRVDRGALTVVAPPLAGDGSTK